MTPEELREKLADFMGWTAIDLDNSCSDPDCCGGPFPMWTYCQKDEEGDWMGISLTETGPYSGSLNVEDWEPDQDRNQLALVLEKVAELSEQDSLIEELARQVMPEDYPADTEPLMVTVWEAFELLTAPPETVCRAILTVIEKEPTQ